MEGFWWFMFFADLLIPLCMLLFGRMMWKRPAKEVGRGWYGYRTALSMKNQETWEFAQKACGRLWWRAGWVLLVVSAVALLPFWGRGVDTVGMAGLVVCGMQCACMIGTVFIVERALKRHFRFGRRGREE